MTDPSPQSSFRAPVVVGFLAGAAGLVLLTIGIVRLVGSIESSPATSAAFVTTTVASSAPATTETPATTGTTAALASDFTTVVDDTGTLSFEVPSDWLEVVGTSWDLEVGTVGVKIAAAVDLDAWYEGWGTPGAFVGVATVSPDVYAPDLGDFGGACTPGETGGREYPGYTTIVQEWVDCGDEGSMFTTALVWPSTFEWSGLIQVVAVDGSATALIDHIIATFSYGS